MTGLKDKVKDLLHPGHKTHTTSNYDPSPLTSNAGTAGTGYGTSAYNQGTTVDSTAMDNTTTLGSGGANYGTTTGAAAGNSAVLPMGGAPATGADYNRDGIPDNQEGRKETIKEKIQDLLPGGGNKRGQEYNSSYNTSDTTGYNTSSGMPSAGGLNNTAVLPMGNPDTTATGYNNQSGTQSITQKLENLTTGNNTGYNASNYDGTVGQDAYGSNMSTTATAGSGTDYNRDGIPDNQEGVKPTLGQKVMNMLPGGNKDRNMDGIPDNQEGYGQRSGTDYNRDGIPDNQQGYKPTLGERVKDMLPGGNKDRNLDGIPDNQEGYGQRSGTDYNRDGIADNQEGYKPTLGDRVKDILPGNNRNTYDKYDSSYDGTGVNQGTYGSSTAVGGAAAGADFDRDGIPDNQEGGAIGKPSLKQKVMNMLPGNNNQSSTGTYGSSYESSGMRGVGLGDSDNQVCVPGYKEAPVNTGEKVFRVTEDHEVEKERMERWVEHRPVEREYVTKVEPTGKVYDGAVTRIDKGVTERDVNEFSCYNTGTTTVQGVQGNPTSTTGQGFAQQGFSGQQGIAGQQGYTGQGY